MRDSAKILHLHFVVTVIPALILFALIAMVGNGCGIAAQADDIAKNCGGMTLEQVKAQNGITDACRNSVQSLLSGFSSNFQGKAVSLGAQLESGTNKPLLYASGTNADGLALSLTDFQAATIKAVAANGTETALAASDFTVSSLAGSTESLASISLVNDYSGSMRDADLDDANTLETDLFTYLPGVYEAEVIQFSSTVTPKLAFSSDKTTLLSAIARDNTYKRESTALFDAVGKGISDLSARSRPIRLLLISTDGLENSSVAFTKDQLVSLVSQNKIRVVIFGTLFADLGVLKDLAGSDGVYVYAQSYVQMRSGLKEFMKSFGNLVRITVNSAYQSAQSFKVTVGGTTLSFKM